MKKETKTGKLSELFNLTEYKGKLLKGLLRHPLQEFTAKQLAAMTGVPWCRVYDQLAGLIKDSLISVKLGWPSTYSTGKEKVFAELLVRQSKARGALADILEIKEKKASAWI